MQNNYGLAHQHKRCFMCHSCQYNIYHLTATDLFWAYFGVKQW